MEVPYFSVLGQEFRTFISSRIGSGPLLFNLLQQTELKFKFFSHFGEQVDLCPVGQSLYFWSIYALLVDLCSLCRSLYCWSTSVPFVDFYAVGRSLLSFCRLIFPVGRPLFFWPIYVMLVYLCSLRRPLFFWSISIPLVKTVDDKGFMRNKQGLGQACVLSLDSSTISWKVVQVKFRLTRWQKLTTIWSNYNS